MPPSPLYLLQASGATPLLWAPRGAVGVVTGANKGIGLEIAAGLAANGLPVVATRVGGVPGAVGDCGLLVDREAPDQLAEAMGRLVHEPGLAADLGRRARRRAVREFSVERMTSRYVEVYERVAAGRRRCKGW